MILRSLNTKLIVSDAVEQPHEDEDGEGTRDERDGKQERVHNSANGCLTAGLETPGHGLVVDNKKPGEMRARWCGHVQVIRCIGVWW